MGVRKRDQWAAGVVAAGAVSVEVDVVVVVVSVDVVAVEVAVPVSSTTAGASAAGAAGAAASFFWQPVVRAIAVTAAKPRVRNFFISLVSFLLFMKLSAPSERKRTPQNDAE